MAQKTRQLRDLLASDEFLYMPSATTPIDSSASAISNISTARATSPATRTCSSIVSSSSPIARDAPVA
jgi:hypothetical protein